jgi:glucokinase
MEKLVLAIDLGGTKTKVGLVTLSGRVSHRTYLSTRSYAHSKAALIVALVESCNKLLQDYNVSKNSICGIGIGLPGPIDYAKGVVNFLPNIPHWERVPLKEIIQKKLKVPTFIDNDVNLITLAEWKYGAGKGAKNILGMTLGTGVGGGLVVDGNIYRGASFSAGEIGHMPINESGPVCNCGGSACLESYVGNNAILKQARRIFKKPDITLEQLSAMAGREKDRRAIKLWQEVGKKIGIALAGAINLLNPERIIIGGGVANAGIFLFAAIRKTVSLRAMPTQRAAVKIVPAKLGDDAGLIGAMLLVKEGLKLKG